MNHRMGRTLVVVVLLAAWPHTAAPAQPAPRAAGVVTALAGQATVTRVALPRSGPLKFRDPVYPRDRITTREQSLVRVLLGGKAVVTVRELSNLTITEEPGRPSVIDILSGKIALVVARFRMGPTESIEIRTPNAVAAIRGTVVVVEVRAEPTAQLTGGPPVYTSIFHVLKDFISIASLLQPMAPPVRVGEGFSLTAFGSILQPPVPSPPRGQILAGLTMPAQQHRSTPDTTQETLIANHQAQAQAVEAFVDGALNPLASPVNPTPSTSTLGVQVENALGESATASGGGNGGPTGPNLLTNGGFENGFAGWVKFVEGGSFGDVFLQSGTISPRSGLVVPPPPQGASAALTDQTGPGSYALYRDFLVPASNPVLRFKLFVGNRTGSFVIPSPDTLSYAASANQQARVDLMTPAAGPQDIGPGVLQNLFRTRVTDNPGDLAGSGYNTYAFDLSGFSGETIRLRFAEVDNQGFFQLGVDDVELFEAANVGESLVSLYGEGLLTTTGRPHLRLSGETHTIGTDPGEAVFTLRGRESAKAPEEIVSGVPMSLGTDRPIHGPGPGPAYPTQAPLLETSGASVNAWHFAKLDAALLEASAPLLRLLAGSSFTTAADAFRLTNGAHLRTLASTDIANLAASTLTVTNGSLVSLTGGSALRVTGNLVSLDGGSTLAIRNGWLVSVTGGSAFSLTGGSLVRFGSAGANVVSIANATPLCGGCSLQTVAGIPVLLAGGATPANVAVKKGFVPFANLGGANKLTLSGSSAAVLRVEGAASQVRLGF